jgi:hypothetical protein
LNAILRRPGEILDLVQECRRLSAELYSAGGVTIDTAIDPRGEPSEGVPIAARTVIQPDGDVVCFATDRYCLDADLRMAHGRNVAAWYGRAESTLSDAVAVGRSLSRALGAIISLLAGGLGASTASGALRVVVPAIVVPLVFVAVGALARLVLRRLVSSVLGRR